MKQYEDDILIPIATDACICISIDDLFLPY